MASDGIALPDRDEFTLTTAAKSYDTVNSSSIRALWDDGYASVPDDLFLFSVPKPPDATKVTLRWPDGEFVVDEAIAEALTRPPTDFEATLSAPESVTSRHEATVTLTVENTGSDAGTFVGALNRIGPNVAFMPITGISLEVEAGESATWTHSFTPHLHSSTDDDPAATFHLNWRDGRQSKIIDIESV